MRLQNPGHAFRWPDGIAFLLMQISFRQQELLRCAVIHLLATALLFWIFDRMGPLEDMREVLNHGVRATGNVVGTDCHNHGRIIYQFSSPNGPVTGFTRSSDVHLGECSYVRIGVALDVQYMANAPYKNFAGNVSRNLSDQVWFDFFSAITVTGVFVWSHFRNRVLVDAN